MKVKITLRTNAGELDHRIITTQADDDPLIGKTVIEMVEDSVLATGDHIDITEEE